MTTPEFDYKWHYDYIRRIVNTYVKSGNTLDDLVQECIEKIIKYRDSYDADKMKYSSWVFMIAKDTAFNYQRDIDKQRFLTYSGVEVYSQTEICTPENEYQAKELAHRIKRTMDTLPDNQRRVMEMYEYEQMPLYKVADELGLAYGSVRNIYMYAKDTVNKAIKDYYDGW